MVEVCPTYSTPIWPGADSGYTILHNARQLLLDPIISDALGRILFDGATGWIDGSENISSFRLNLKLKTQVHGKYMRLLG